MPLSCDHDATRASLPVFLAATTGHKFQILPWGEVHLNGNCVGCDSTLSIALCDCRGTARHGEIETAPNRCVECLSRVYLFPPRPSPDSPEALAHLIT